MEAASIRVAVARPPARAWFAEAGRGVLVVRLDVPQDWRIGYYGLDRLDHRVPDAAVVRDMLARYAAERQAVLAFIDERGQAVAEIVTIEAIQ